MWWWCLDAGTGHTGAMVGSRTLVVPVLWCNVCSGAQCTTTLVQCAHHQERRTGATRGWGAGSTCTARTSHLMVTMQLIVTRGLGFFLDGLNSEGGGLDLFY